MTFIFIKLLFINVIVEFHKKMELKNEDEFLEKLEEKNTNLTLTKIIKKLNQYLNPFKIIIQKQDLFK